MLAALQEFEFDQFAFSRRNLHGNDLGLRCAPWGQHRNGWLERYRQKRYAAIDPIARLALRSTLPVQWDGRSFARNPYAQPFLHDAASFGMGSGITMVIHWPGAGHVDFFSVTAPPPLITARRSRDLAERMPELWALGAYGHALLPQSAFALRPECNCYRPSRADIQTRCLWHRASMAERRR